MPDVAKPLPKNAPRFVQGQASFLDDDPATVVSWKNRAMFDANGHEVPPAGLPRFEPSRLNTVARVVAQNMDRQRGHGPSFPLPQYRPESTNTNLAMLAVESFARHMTDEGWQMQEGLAAAGYRLFGVGYPGGRAESYVPGVLYQARPGTLIVQDQREWDGSRAGCFEKGRDFTGLECLRDRHDVFRVAVHKDCHQDPEYHRESHDKFHPHSWITYVHPDIVMHFCPWMRRANLIRTWHTVRSAGSQDCVAPGVPAYSSSRPIAAVVSGAVSRYYPLREKIFAWAKSGELRDVMTLRHPGYGAKGSHTPKYLELLAQCKVSICTASRFGFALRKMIEATACGCLCITNLCTDDRYPSIDENMTRIPDDITLAELNDLVGELVASYDPERQWHFAKLACDRYDYRRVGVELAGNIEAMRVAWTT